MLQKDFILCKTRSLFNEFIGPIITDADKQKQKFQGQSIAAILVSGSLTGWPAEFFSISSVVYHWYLPQTSKIRVIACKIPMTFWIFKVPIVALSYQANKFGV